MGTVNFYLKKPEKSTNRSLIYLQFKYSGNKLVFSFGQSIDPKNWNPSKQRVKNNKETTLEGDHYLNDTLDGLVRETELVYKSALKNGIPPPEIIKRQLVSFLNRNNNISDTNETLHKLIDRFISGEIKYKGRMKSQATLNNYRAVKRHVSDFETKYRYKLEFDTINLDFFYKYTTYLRELGLSNNTIAKDIRLFKVFMGEAVDLGYTSNNQFRHKKFSFQEEETDAVYLSENELIKLFRYDFSDNKKIEQVRDLFVFGAFVGLRFSDFSNIKPENIVTIDGSNFIKLITQKTKELVIIPCSPIILEIFEKYSLNDNRLPKSISNQKFNEYIKIAAKIVGLTETGRLSTNPNLALFDCISSHTARRSFATNLYLEGFPTAEIMKITGHRTEKAFMKYIRVSKLDAAKRLNTHIQTMWNRKLLRVAG